MSITASRFFSIDPAHLTPDIEDSFFTDLKTRNNTFKRTSSDRFRDLDDCCVRHFDGEGALLREVLDIGVSSGATTLALSDRLKANGRSPRIVGTDISLTGYLVPIAKGFRVLADEQGHALQYELLGHGIRAWERRADYVTGMVAVRRLLRSVAERRARREIHDNPAALDRIRLLSPRLAGYPDIEIEKNDIFCRTEGYAERFDFVRVANILTPAISTR